MFALKEPTAGGLEGFTYDITIGLRARGHTVVLFATPGCDPCLEAVESFRSFNASGRDGDTAGQYIKVHHDYLRLMQSVDEYEFDVIFNNSLHYVPPTMASMLSTPMITVLHTPPIPELIAAYKNLHHPCHIYTPSAANEKEWRPFVEVAGVIPNAVDLEIWRPGEDRGAHAVWFGRIVPEKGLHLAIDAARMAGIHLKVAGPMCDTDYYNRCIAPRWGSGVEYLGHLPREVLAVEVAHAALTLVTPCWQEPFGLVVAESLACGTPVAGFANGALPELVSSDVGVLCAEDASALASAIKYALELSPDDCRKRAENNWSQRTMLDRYEAALHAAALSKG